MADAAQGRKFIIPLLFAAVAAGMIVSLFLGRYPLSLPQMFDVLFGEANGVATNIVWSVRLPRIVMAVLTGSALSAAGASYQGIFKNPMVSPSLLGVSSGASFGAALSIVLGLGGTLIQPMAFVFGLAAVGIVYAVSRFLIKKMDGTLSLVLTGIVVSSLFVSLLSLLKYVGDPYNDLPAITFWTMGGLTRVRAPDLLYVGITVVLSMAVLWAMKYRLNIMTLSEDEAKSLGVHTGRVRGVAILAATVMTAAVVSIAGTVSWVGLVMPHVARMIVGPDYRKTLAASVALGALFMLALDNISRTVFAAEIPHGILTSMLGTPFFIYLMIRGKKSW